MSSQLRVYMSSMESVLQPVILIISRVLRSPFAFLFNARIIDDGVGGFVVFLAFGVGVDVFMVVGCGVFIVC